MLTEPDILLEGCPTELEEDLKEIVDLSEDFLDYVDVNPHQNINEIKVDLQEAKNYLFQIISRFATLIDERIDEIILQKEDKDKILTMGWKMKFDEDVGAIMGDLKKKPTDRLEGSIGITTLLKFSGDLKTTYDFLIYTPIVRANKKKFESIEKYFGIIFVTVRANASRLGYKEKPSIDISRKILPKPEDMIATLGKVKKPFEEKGLKDLEGLGSEESEESEESDDENDEEVKEIDD